MAKFVVGHERDGAGGVQQCIHLPTTKASHGHWLSGLCARAAAISGALRFIKFFAAKSSGVCDAACGGAHPVTIL